MQDLIDRIPSSEHDSYILFEEPLEFNCPATLIVCKGDVPQPRSSHKSFVKDKKLYLYGGTTDQGEQMGLYSIDINRLSEAEPAPLILKQLKLWGNQSLVGVSGTAFTTEQFSQSLQCRPFALMFGGWTGSQYSDQLSLLNTTNMEIKSLIKEEPKFADPSGPYARVAVSIGNSKEIEKYQQSKYPPPRKDHTLVYVPSENKICMYGGWDGQFTSGGKQELWILSSNWKWEKYPGYSRRGHTSVVVDDHRGNGFLVFGGVRGVKCYSNQCLFFDVKNKKWHAIKQNKSTPRGRAYHTADKIGNKIVYVGGIGEQQEIYAEVWMFCLDKHQWSRICIADTTLEEQVRRIGHTTFVVDKKLYVLGGTTLRKGKFVKCSLSEIVCLDFSEIIAENKPAKSINLPVLEVCRSGSTIAPNIHSIDHRWDIAAFGFNTNKKDDLEDFYKELEEKMPGISEMEMNESGP